MYSGTRTKAFRLAKKKKFVTVARMNGRRSGWGDTAHPTTAERAARSLDRRDRSRDGAACYRDGPRPSMPAVHDLIPSPVDTSHGPAELALTLDPAFQGLPDTAHGGSVLAIFDAVTARSGARQLTGHYHRRVPLGSPLRLGVDARGRETTLRLLDGSGTLLVDGAVTAADGET